MGPGLTDQLRADLYVNGYRVAKTAMTRQELDRAIEVGIVYLDFKGALHGGATVDIHVVLTGTE